MCRAPSHIMRLSLLLSSALLLASVGCSSDVGGPVADPRELTDERVRITSPIEYTDDLLFPELEGRLVDTLVEDERLVLTYDGEPAVLIEEGAVLAGGIERATPYLRRVLSVERDGLVFTLTTRPALPEEAIRNGAWHYTVGEPYTQAQLTDALEEDRFDALLEEAEQSRNDDLGVGGRMDSLIDDEEGVGSVSQASRRSRIPNGGSLIKAIEDSTIQCSYEGRNFSLGVDMSSQYAMTVASSIDDGSRVDQVDATLDFVFELETTGFIAGGAKCVRELESRNFIPYRFREGLVSIAGIPVWFDMKAVAYGKAEVKLRLGDVESSSKTDFLYRIRYSSREATPIEPTCIVDLEQANRLGRAASEAIDCEPAFECEAGCNPDYCSEGDEACGGVCCDSPPTAAEFAPLYMDIPVVAVDNTYVCNYNRFIELPCSTAEALGVEYQDQSGVRRVATTSRRTWDWDVTHELTPQRARMDSGRGATMDFEVEGGALFELMLYRILYFEMKAGPKVGTTVTWNRDACLINTSTAVDIGLNFEVGVREPIFLSDLAKWEYRLAYPILNVPDKSYRIESCRPVTTVSCDREIDCHSCALIDGCAWVSAAHEIDVDSPRAGGSCMAEREVPRNPNLWAATNINLCRNCAAYRTVEACQADSGFCALCDDGGYFDRSCINTNRESPHISGPVACGSWR